MDGELGTTRLQLLFGTRTRNKYHEEIVTSLGNN
jgi:hypothetical protein